jgi:RNA polymerase sigma-70 factor (ECF subfamily)
MLGDPQEAEDVVQDVFLKAHEAERLGRPPMDWGAWLTRVAVNACRDRRRAGGWMRFRLRSTHIDDLPLVADTLAPSEAAVSEDTRRRIWVAFRALPRRQQEVFALRYIEEQATTDVALALGLSAGSVKRHLYRAVPHLRRALGDARCPPASRTTHSPACTPTSARSRSARTWPAVPPAPGARVSSAATWTSSPRCCATRASP